MALVMVEPVLLRLFVVGVAWNSKGW